MFDGNTFFPVTGMPMRKMACMIRPLADADPVPLAVAILKANSLVIHDIDMKSNSRLQLQLAVGCSEPSSRRQATLPAAEPRAGLTYDRRQRNHASLPAYGICSMNLRMSHA